MAIRGAVNVDMYPPRQRGTPTAVYAAGTMMGPILSSVLGVIMTVALGWRRLFGIASIRV
jgi:MFS family permease